MPPIVIDAPRSVDLKAYDPDDTAGLTPEAAAARLPVLEQRLCDLQKRALKAPGIHAGEETASSRSRGMPQRQRYQALDNVVGRW